jgi:hypothetical protein
VLRRRLSWYSAIARHQAASLQCLRRLPSTAKHCAHTKLNDMLAWLQSPALPETEAAGTWEPHWHSSRPHLTGYDVLQVI